jgi:hypothetical protein
MAQKFTEIKNLIMGTYDEMNFSEVPEGDYLKISNLLQKIYKICDEYEDDEENDAINDPLNDAFIEDDEDDTDWSSASDTIFTGITERNDISAILENSRVYYDMFIAPLSCECDPNTYQLCESCIRDSSINRIKSCCNYNNFISEEPSVLHVLEKFDTNITPIEPFLFIQEPSILEEKDENYYVRYFRLCIDLYDYKSKDITLLLYIFICNFTIKHLHALSSKYYQIVQKVYGKINELLIYEDYTNDILSKYGEDISLIHRWKNIILGVLRY